MADKAVHWIAMNGTHGCIPDNCDVYKTKIAAINGLAALLELDPLQVAGLRRWGVTECRPGQGAEYVEIVECECGNPGQHEEVG